MNKTFVDPPLGWKYGFPKFYTNEPENFNQWLVDNGYPQGEINLWPKQVVPCRMWVEEEYIAEQELIKKLRNERDEARWEICGFHHLTGFLAGDYAISRGWNYFNDEKRWAEFPPSVTDFKEFLKGQDQIWLDRVDRLTKERDEARREVCGLLVACHTDPDDDDKPDPNLKHIHAGIRGWDCYKNYINYKENTNG